MALRSFVWSLVIAVNLLLCVSGHSYVKPPDCPDDSIFYDRTDDQLGHTAMVDTEDECAADCDEAYYCVAYNIENREDLRCELNNRRAGKFGEDLQWAQGWNYYDKREEGREYDTCEGLTHTYDESQQEMMSSGEPTLLVNRGHQRSWWGKDALYNDDKYYLTYDDWNNAHTIYEYADESKFINNQNAITHSLSPSGISSNFLVYGRKFWYRESDRMTVLVYDLDQDKLVGNISETHGYEWFYGPYSSQCQMDKGQHAGLDIEADEHGVWIIYGQPTDHCHMVVQKIDHETYTVTWSKVYPGLVYSEGGGGFMAHGIYYMTDHYNHVPTFIRYQLNVKNDTWVLVSDSYAKRKEWMIPEGIQAHIHYNPIDKFVYATNYARRYRYENMQWIKLWY